MGDLKGKRISLNSLLSLGLLQALTFAFARGEDLASDSFERPFLGRLCVLKLAIATPGLNAYSETFIRAHIERLPADVIVLYGGTPPTRLGDGSSVIPPFTLARHLRWTIERRLRHLTWEDRTRLSLVAALRRLQPHAVLAEYGTMGVAVMDACTELGVPLIVHFHGYEAHRRVVLAQAGQHYPKLFVSAAAVVAASQHMAKQLMTLGAPEQKTHVNPYGVDTNQFKGADPGQSPPIFVAVGRFVEKKAPHLTLLAFRAVLESCPEARLVMVGDGPLWEVCKHLAKVLGIAHALEFRGPASAVEVASALREGRAFVQHSMTAACGDMESFGVVFIEAGASGLPVISTKHNGIPEVVVHGETGFLVEEGDIDGMAEQMIRLAEDPELAARLGKAGREHVCAEFSMEKSIAGLWSIIEGAIQDAVR